MSWVRNSFHNPLHASSGSQRVAEKLAGDTRGKVYLEDAGFDWKILGPDVQDVEYVAWQCDQDAYACSGQKCSAQSIMFMHENWAPSGLLQKFGERAQRRTMDNLTVGPVITVTTGRMLSHVDRLLSIPGTPHALPSAPAVPLLDVAVRKKLAWRHKTATSACVVACPAVPEACMHASASASPAALPHASRPPAAICLGGTAAC